MNKDFAMFGGVSLVFCYSRQLRFIAADEDEAVGFF